jgi:predicted Zn-dependent peptidase
MNVQETKLLNGVRLITIERPQTPTVAIKVYVRAGSRYDSNRLGIAHLLEHLLFKGTKNRSTREIYAVIEQVGGEIGANTAKEYTCFHTVLPSQHFEVGLEVLADLLINPLLDKKAFWEEKAITLEEIRRTQDRTSVIFDIFSRTLWRKHPLRHSILGDLEDLKDMSHEEVVSFYRQRYTTGNVVIVLCGNLKHDDVRELVAEKLADFPQGEELRPRRRGSPSR